VLNGFGLPHLLIIAAIVIIFFGAKRLPDAARGMGRAMRIFRSETQGMRDDMAADNPPPAQQPPAPQQFAPPQQIAQPQPYVAPTSAEQPAHAQTDQQR